MASTSVSDFGTKRPFGFNFQSGGGEQAMQAARLTGGNAAACVCVCMHVLQAGRWQAGRHAGIVGLHHTVVLNKHAACARCRSLCCKRLQLISPLKTFTCVRSLPRMRAACADGCH
jgi:hypothetical protein